MKLRTTIGAFALAGAMTVGAAAPALAEDPPPDLPPRACAALRETLQDLRIANRHLNREIHRLEVAVARATDNGNTEAAARLQARLDAIEARQDRVVDRVTAIRDRLADRCTPDEVPAT